MAQTPQAVRYCCTAADYREGRHYRYLVQEHMFTEWYEKRHGAPPTEAQIKQNFYLCVEKKGMRWLQEVAECPVCQRHIAACRQTGDDPFAPNVAVLSQLRAFLKA